MDLLRGRVRERVDRRGGAHLGPGRADPTLHVVKGTQSKLSVAALCCYRPGHAPRMLYRTRPGWYHDRDLIALLDAAHQELAAPIIVV